MIEAIAVAKYGIAEALAGTIRDALGRRDTGHVAFHGCIDWHSAVHGTWALTAYTRLTGDRRYEAFLADVLRPEKLAEERAFLASQPEFEMPYGRAWFLRLALEHRAAGGGALLQPMAADILASLLARYDAHAPDPRQGSYASDAWALINMHDYAESLGLAAALARVRALVDRHFVQGDLACSYELEAGHFMAVPTNWAWLVSRVLSPERFDRWCQEFFGSIGLPQPVTQPTTWHHHGLNFSRAWGLWGLHAASRSRPLKSACLAAYVAHFRESYDDADRWRGSYEGVGHWVPQFGMFALAPLFLGETVAGSASPNNSLI
jgi:hypothetical protein